jgi:hypothetical protein
MRAAPVDPSLTRDDPRAPVCSTLEKSLPVCHLSAVPVLASTIHYKQKLSLETDCELILPIVFQ